MTVFHHHIEQRSKSIQQTNTTNHHSIQVLQQVYLSSALETVREPLTLTECNFFLAAVARTLSHST